MTIKVGASLSLSGRFANQGRQARRGLALWVEGVNSTGGLRLPGSGAPVAVKFVVYDDQSRTGPAASLTERLIVEDRVDLLFGPYSSVLVLAAAAVAETHGKVLWNHGGSTDALHEQRLGFVVDLLTPASEYFGPVLEMIAAWDPGARRVALLRGARGTFPVAVAEGAAAACRRLGLELALEASYPEEAGGFGFGPLMEQLEAAQPDIVLGVGRTELDLELARRLRARNGGPAWIGLVAAPIELFGDSLGKDADGFLGPSQWEADLPERDVFGPTGIEFAERFRTRFGIEPDYPAAQACAAGIVAQRCVELAGLDDGRLRETVLPLELSSFYGGFRLDPGSGRQVGHRIVVVQWQRGRKVVVWPPDLAAGEPHRP